MASDAGWKDGVDLFFCLTGPSSGHVLPLLASKDTANGLPILGMAFGGSQTPHRVSLAGLGAILGAVTRREDSFSTESLFAFC